MTMIRAALRLVTVAALAGVKGARPTLAEGRVYDSRIDGLDPADLSEAGKPVIIVRCEDDEGEALNENNGGPPFERNIDLCVEIGMVAREQDGEEIVVGYAATDAELEAFIDLVEFQVVTTLTRSVAALPTLWRRLGRAYSYKSHRQAMGESGIKFAMRETIYKVMSNDDSELKLYRLGVDTLPTGFDRFPEPLQTVAKALPEGSQRTLLLAMANASPVLVTNPLGGVDITYAQDNPDDPAHDTTFTLPVELPE
jgi:hypothetical protein